MPDQQENVDPTFDSDRKENFAEFVKERQTKAFDKNERDQLECIDGGNYFYALKRDGWHVYDPSDWWDQINCTVIPKFIPLGQFQKFLNWLEHHDRGVEYRGRQIGENAMRVAIRKLLGAAPLTDLD